MKALNMIKLSAVLLVITILLSSNAIALTKSVRVKTNITCGGCKSKIETGFKGIEGIEKTEVDVASKIVTISYDTDAITESNITKTISGLGYSAEIITADTEVKASSSKESCVPKKGCGSKKSGDKKSCGSKESGVKKS